MNPADRSPVQPALPEPGRSARARPAAPAGLTGRDAGRLLFVAEMHGVQLDLLAVLMRTSGTSTRTIVSRWQRQGLADTARLSPGAPWVWLTRSGLTATRP